MPDSNFPQAFAKKRMKESPERELIRKTFTVREMDLPPSVLMTKKGMARWFALSFGLISEKESRDTILEILDLLFSINFSKKRGAEAEEIYSELKKKGIKASDKLVRYHLKNMADLGLLEKKGRKYFFCSPTEGEKDDVKKGFEEKVVRKIDESALRISNVLGKIAESYGKK